MAMKVGDWVKLTRIPHHVGRVTAVRTDGTCDVVGVHDDLWTNPDRYFGFDPRRCDEWEHATDDDVFIARFLNKVDYEYCQCRWCGMSPEHHQSECPVAELELIRKTHSESADQRERSLLTEIADFLANEGYPWTANMIRDGSWRKRP